jgi:Tol biopolymer transport system component
MSNSHEQGATVYDHGVSHRLRWIGTLAVAVAFLVAPAVSQAALVFVRNPLKPVVFAANDNGSEAHRIGSGRNPRVSPDGQTVAYLHEGGGSYNTRPELMVAPAGGGSPRKLAANWQDSFVFAWSPDSTTVAVILGPELGRQHLTTIDVETGAQHTVASGYFSGVSFAPEGGQLVYSKASNEKLPPKNDVFQANLSGGKPVRLTNDHRSQSPLWGPSGKIVFVKLLNQKQRKYGPKNELFLMNPNGSQQRRLTHTKVGALLQGLYPTQWSANGRRLLAEFEGQDTSYAVTVNPMTGAQRTVAKAGEQGFVGTALSADGKTVLGFTGGFEPGPNHNAATVPYAGGKLEVLVRGAFEPDWSR